MRDIIIVGAGPAGVSAGLYCKARGKDILLLEKDRIGGLIKSVSKVSHYASVAQEETGPSFAKKLEDQLAYSDIPLEEGEVLSIEKGPEGFLVKTASKSYQAKKVIYAAGSRLKELDQAVTKGYACKHWPLGQEESLRDKVVLMNGGSDGACKEALYLAKFARQVHLIQDQDRLLAIHEFRQQIEAAENILVHTSAKITKIVQEGGQAIQVELSNGETIEDSKGMEIYVQIGQVGNTAPLEQICPIAGPFVDTDLASQVPGLYFAGDIRVKAVKQIATAVADGCQAAVLACKD